MTDKEAIKQLELIAINITNEIGTEIGIAESEYASKILDTYNTAQEALKEREERQKGCAYCYTDARYNPFTSDYNFCPMCGRKLKED